MKKFAILLVAFLLCSYAFAQRNGAAETHYPSDIQKIATLKSNGRILMMNEQSQVPAAEFFATFHNHFGLANAEDMVLAEKSEARNGMVTYRYHQQYMGVPIQGATMLLHEKDGKVTYANGVIISNFSHPFTPLVAASDAVELSILADGATSYAWQNPTLEQDLKETMHDEKATYYPTPKLMFYDATFSNDARQFRLVYEVNLFSLEPLRSSIYYIDAVTGEILNVVQRHRNVNVEVQAKTRYNGTQTIVVDSLAPNQFVLRETTRGEGNGIYTRDLQNNGSLFEVNPAYAVDVVETDNFFDTDSVANAAHFGAENTYDYYYNTFGRNSIDNNGMRLMSYVHLGQNVENAAWTNGAMFYGDGVNGYQFTFLSVCGHEITHGLTERTANLVYQDESGALNEAFSDMFGQMVAYYASDTLKWTIGDELGQVFRDMANPKANQNPDTYHGTYWVSDNSDNGGVHSNSGPANYWFKMLCVGGQGVNDNGYAYDLAGIGTAKAANIAYYTLTENLMETSDYHDTYELSLLVAADLYGECSPEVYAVAETWQAVGVGYRYSDTVTYVENVLTPATGCALTDAEPVILELSYNSCDQPLAAGTAIHVRLMFDQTTEILDTVVLEQQVEPGEFFQLALNRTVDASAIGQHRLDVFAKPDFSDNYVDSLMNYRFENRVYQNSDLHIVDLVSPVSSCFLTAETPIVCSVTFDICDSIMAGDSIRLGYKLGNGDTIIEWLVLPQTVTAADTLIYVFGTPADFTAEARTTVRILGLNPGDGDASDNQLSRIVVRPRPLNELPGGRIGFDDGNMNSYYFTETGEYSDLSISTLTGYNGGKLVKISGGNVMEYYDQLTFPDFGQSWWDVNPEMSSRITFCADATDYAQFAVNFDLKQTSGIDVYNQMLGGYIPDGIDLHQSSLMRVLIDGEQVGEDYMPSTGNSDPFIYQGINLAAYTGALHSITFEAKCIAGNLFMYTLDNVYLDNITISESDNITDYTDGQCTFTAFPNPTTGNLNIQFDTDLEQGAEYVVCDMFGKTLLRGTINDASTTVNLNGLANGIYVLQVRSGNQLLGTSKIAKQGL